MASNGNGHGNGNGNGHGNGRGNGHSNGNGNGNGYGAYYVDELDDERDEVLSKLNIKERRFVEAYCGEAAGNATEAVRMAGVKGATREALHTAAWAIFRRPHVKTAIAALTEMDPLIPGRIERLRALGRILRREEKDHRVLKDGTVIEVPCRVSDQHAAIRTLAQLAGELRERADKPNDQDLPADLTVDELFQLAGVTRSNPAPVRH